MARAHFVAKARTDHPEGGIKKGESYYWWAFMVGGRGGPKHYSKTPPRRSQLTQSEFYSALYEIEDSLNALPADDGLGDAVASIVSDLENLAEETRTKKENIGYIRLSHARAFFLGRQRGLKWRREQRARNRARAKKQRKSHG